MEIKLNQPIGPAKFFTILPHLKIIAKIKGIKLNKPKNFEKIVLLYKIQQN